MKPLLAPVTYQGAKVRLAPAIMDVIGRPWERGAFFDLCCGSGAVALEALQRGCPPERLVMVDCGPWALFWQAVAEGRFDLDRFDQIIATLPDKALFHEWAREVSEQQPQLADVPYIFLLLQSCAFGGKSVGFAEGRWQVASGWRRYWVPTETSNRRSPVNPAMPMPNTIRTRVAELIPRMSGVTVLNCDVMDVFPHSSDTVYVDPPYTGYEPYQGSIQFDVVELARRLVHDGVGVYVSEAKPLMEGAICLSNGRLKGGISGLRDAPNGEWLTRFSAKEVRTHEG